MILSITFWFFLALFFFLNLFLVYKDWKFKVIPNYILLSLLFLLPILLTLSLKLGFISGFQWGFYLTSILFTFVVSFLLYLYNGWAAGDAKYTIVLSMFLFDGRYISFAGNIAVFTIVILCLISLIQSRFIDAIDPSKMEKNTKNEVKKKTTKEWILNIIQYSLVIVLSFSLLQMFSEKLVNYFYSIGDPKSPLYPALIIAVVSIFRLINKNIRKAAIKGVNYTLILALTVILILFVYYRSVDRFIYDLFFFGKYSLPTMALISGFLYLFSKFIRRYDLIPRTIKNIKIGDNLDVEHIIGTFAPDFEEKERYSMVEEVQSVFSKTVDSHALRFLKALAQKCGRDETTTYMIVYNNHPYAHIIFMAFLYTIVMQQNLAYIALHMWYAFLDNSYTLFDKLFF
ncbi:MAG: hypothetical protein HHAS10_09810 [Candidatus Altimarinota bacterium]